MLVVETLNAIKIAETVEGGPLQLDEKLGPKSKNAVPGEGRIEREEFSDCELTSSGQG